MSGSALQPNYLAIGGGVRDPANALSQYSMSVQPWIDTLPFALRAWHSLTPEQQAMYLRAYQAHTGALANERELQGLRARRDADPNWAEQYQGF